MPLAKPTRPSSLRFIVRLAPPRPGRLLGLTLGAAEAALEVVEDEPDGGGGARRGRDPTAARADDEDAPLRGRRLELGHLAVLAHLRHAVEELRTRACERLRGRVVL